MKKAISVVILILLILEGMTACSIFKSDDETSLSTMGPVDNIFTTPTEMPAAPSDNELVNDAPDGDENQFASSSFSHSIESTDLVYDGGELRVSLRCKGAVGRNIGYLLILDGQPQPYKLADDGEYSYMHTIAIVKGSMSFEFIFTPVVGDVGEVLELYVVNIYDPEYRISADGVMGNKHTRGSIPVMTTVTFLATPSFVDFPTTDARITNIAAVYVDVCEDDVSGWREEDFRTRSEYTIYVNGNDKYTTFWNVSPNEPICVHLELWGNPEAEFGVVFYLNDKPVFPTDKNSLLLHNEQGKKLVMDIQIDNSDLENESVLYVVLVYRNIYEVYYGGIQWFADAHTYYMIAQEKP